MKGTSRNLRDEGTVMGQQRGLYRVVIDLAGTLQRGEVMAPCQVLDLTETGLRFRTSLPVATGESLQLELNLADGRAICCSVHVTNVMPPFVGARIADISSVHQKQLSQFIEQLISINLMGF